MQLPSIGVIITVIQYMTSQNLVNISEAPAASIDSLIIRTGAILPRDTPVHIYHTTWHQTQEDGNLYSHWP